MKILLIDDDKNIVDVIENTFRISWPEVAFITAYSATDGVKKALNESPDIILLDLGLPDISGFEAIERMRRFCQTPIMIISVREEEQNIVKALSLGADDYLRKPFGQLELVARIKALARRYFKDKDEDIITAGNMVLDTSTSKLSINGRSFKLTNTERDIIRHLMLKQGKLATSRELANAVYGSLPGEENIKTFIYRLRNKIELDPQNPGVIINERGLGYCLNLKG
ncbi:MAG: response regulator transcription factor [Dehalococcoidaceae bacterium]|nr:response regulator transcription factor [Dehalococcoidaceae bacterium]